MAVLDTSGYTGSETFYRHAIVGGVRYTEGVRYVAQAAGAYWLIDEIVLSGISRTAEPWQAWTLKVDGSRATLTADDGDGRILKTKAIEYTDFPDPEITIWYIDGTLLLPSEY